MSMTTIYREGDYELVKHSEGLAPYAIFVRADGFWQQVSKWYCTCGWADKKLKQLLKKRKQQQNKKEKTMGKKTKVRINNKVFDSMKRASKFLGVSNPFLAKILRGKKATTYKDLLIEKMDNEPVKTPKRVRRGIPVLVDGKLYKRIKDAEEKLGLPDKSIAVALRAGRKQYRGHTIEYAVPSDAKVNAVRKSATPKVKCITTGKVYYSFHEAAKDAQANRWTMSIKMETSGGFIDKNGNEYVRLEPMKTKNKYTDTGKTMQRDVEYAQRPSRAKTAETFVPIDTALNLANADARFPIVDMPKPLTQAPVEQPKPKVPQVVKDAINEKIINMLKNANIYEDIVDLLNYGGFTTVKVLNDK